MWVPSRKPKAEFTCTEWDFIQSLAQTPHHWPQGAAAVLNEMRRSRHTMSCLHYFCKIPRLVVWENTGKESPPPNDSTEPCQKPINHIRCVPTKCQAPSWKYWVPASPIGFYSTEELVQP
ncbi:unnamed protein product [Caretta caretta]